MLVLSRKAGSKIKIGDDITIQVLRVGPRVVRFGIDAPDSVRVVREELEQLPDRSIVSERIASDAHDAQGTNP